jgi:SAM-dependent methyltransferase/uncharacterized protein YbaR (Trm112 family)
MTMPRDIRDLLRCPVCKGVLKDGGEQLVCAQAPCGASFPKIQDGVPVLINETNSIFEIADFVHHKDTFFKLGDRTDERRALRSFLPTYSANWAARRNFAKLRTLLHERTERARVLVIGGSFLAKGMEDLLADPALELVETDVSLGPRTQVVMDAHDIPFANSSFDAVIAQAVLEHVLDPHRCVAEIHRVLRPSGIVFSETPFMQQVHGGRWDFTRWSLQGLRRLFRNFRELDAGPLAGPGTVLGWSWRYLLAGFAPGRKWGTASKIIARITGWPLKYLDWISFNREAFRDGASGYYFFGERSETQLADKELMRLYEGLGR